MSYLASYFTEGQGQRDYLIEELDSYYDPVEIERLGPNNIDTTHLSGMGSLRFRVLDRLRSDGWPVLGPALPRDASRNARFTQANLVRFLNAKLAADNPDFLMIGPQNNVAGMFLNKRCCDTRFIFATYDVESVRLGRLRKGLGPLKALGAHLEHRRGAQFERRYLKLFDGVIAVSELDKQIFVDEYGLDPARVSVVDNGVDTDYFSLALPEQSDSLVVMFPANFGYPPNHKAALRLVQKIMPLVWRTRPDAELWLVGQQPAPEILALGDNRRVFVTGRVESVIPYFRRASVMCAPLEQGSGTKTKVIEAMSAGLPVVCSKLAAEGLNVNSGEHAIIDDRDEVMAAAILRLADQPQEARALAESARRVVERYYAWDAVLPKIEPWLHELAALPRIMPETEQRVA